MNQTAPIMDSSVSQRVVRASATPRRITVKDVALRAGVQHASVCVVLNGAKSNTHVSAASRQRILAAAEELGYKRNGSMVTARTGRFNSAALLLSTDASRSNLPQRTWEGIHDELAAHSMHLTLARLPDEKLTDEGVVPKILREWMADGLLIDYTNHIPRKMLDLIRANQLPAVWLNSQQESDCVYPADREASQRLTRYLLELGHQQVLYLDLTHTLNNPNEHYSYAERVAGYCDAMLEAGLKPQIQPEVWVPHQERKAFVIKVLQSEKRPTAIVTYGPVEIDIIMAVLVELGLRIPHDLSLVSFSAEGSTYLGEELTMCFAPDYAMGWQAAQMLRKKIENPKETFAPEILPFQFVPGATTGPCNQASG